MPVSNEQAQATYLSAREALDAISRSRNATRAQKTAAREERNRLDVEFVGQNIIEIEARTARFEEFISRMETVIESLTSNALLRGVRGITEVIASTRSGMRP